MSRKMRSPFNQQPLGTRGPSDDDAPAAPSRASRAPRLDPFSDLDYTDDIVTADRPILRDHDDDDRHGLQPLPRLDDGRAGAPAEGLLKTSVSLDKPTRDERPPLAAHDDEPDDDDPHDAGDWGEVNAVAERLGAAGGALLGVCEPVLDLLCQLNRAKRLGHRPLPWEPEPVRAQFEAAIQQAAAAARTAKLEADFANVVGPIRCAADVVMTRAGFAWSAPWTPLAAKWAQPDRVLMAAAAYALQDGRASAVPALEVLNVCVAFTADLLRPVRGQPDSSRLLEQFARRLRRAADQPLCPSAYEGVFTRAILPPVGRRLKVLAALSVSLLLIAVAAAVTLNVFYASRLHKSVETFRAAMNSQH